MPNNSPSCGLTKSQGFTLIELLVALLISSIILAVAIPSYKSYAMKSRRSDAITALNSVMLAQERYRSGNTSYAGSLSALFPGSPTLATHYDITIPSATGSAFVLNAKAKTSGLQAADVDCAELIVGMSSGQLTYSSKNSSGTASQGCWSK